METALRETEEEIGLPRDKVVVLGKLSPIVTVTDFYVEPYVAAIPYPVELKPSPDEIEALWEIPVAALMAPTAVEERELPGRAPAHHDLTGRVPRPGQPHSSHRHAGPPTP